MEGDTEDAAATKSIIIDFHYNGTFAPKPLAYYDGERASVRDVDFSGMEFSDFDSFVRRLLPSRTGTLHGLIIYYCVPKCSLTEGLHIIHNDGDYKEFIECAMMHDNRIDVYIDHYNEPLFDWIEEEDPEAEYEEDVDEDVDSILSDDAHIEHEKDDFVIPIRREAVDKLLDDLCPDEEGNDEEDGPDNQDPLLTLCMMRLCHGIRWFLF